MFNKLIYNNKVELRFYLRLPPLVAADHRIELSSSSLSYPFPSGSFGLPSSSTLLALEMNWISMMFRKRQVLRDIGHLCKLLLERNKTYLVTTELAPVPASIRFLASSILTRSRWTLLFFGKNLPPCSTQYLMNNRNRYDTSESNHNSYRKIMQ